MAEFKKPVVRAQKKVAKAQADIFVARMEAIDSILEGADPDDIMLVCVTALAEVAPLCCDQHLEEFKAELLERLDHCVAMARENAEADAAEVEDTPPQLH
jgi:hypothetical protein